jgi:hypothetical protein
MTTQYEVVEAEENLKRAKAARAKEVREEWKQKARQFAREARNAKDAFLNAKEQFAKANAEEDALKSKQQQVYFHLETLEQNFRLLEIPLPEEEEAYASEKERLNGQLVPIRAAIRLAQERRGLAWNAELWHRGNYATLEHAYRNAKTLANGGKLGVIEGGISRVE